MSLKKYDELTEAQQKLVWVMYSDKDTVSQYLYNFEGDAYKGRQFIPSKHTVIEKDVVKSVLEEPKVEEVKEVKKVTRKTKKK